jgi:hypothetical protein
LSGSFHMTGHSWATTSVQYRGVPTKTWREVPLPTSFEVRNLLSKVGGGLDRDLRRETELWRARLGSSVFTGYQNGTIYCTGGLEPDLTHIYLRIDEKVRARRRSKIRRR